MDCPTQGYCELNPCTGRCKTKPTPRSPAEPMEYREFDMAQVAAVSRSRADPVVNPTLVAGRKDDGGKVRLDLLPPEAMTEIAKVLTFGAQKYAAHNWRGGFAWSRTLAALLRHLYAWMRGEDNDPETGLSHMAHVGCNVMFMLTFILTKTGTDDRFKS